MRIIKSCETCLLGKQAVRAEGIADADARASYLAEVQSILDGRRETDTAPYLVYLFNQAYARRFGQTHDYRAAKREYNDLVLGMEQALEDRIHAAADPLERAIVYARAGNYIDFGALNHPDKAEFLALFDTVDDQRLDPATYAAFRESCAAARTFLLVCDNCGEIVLDKLFLRQLRAAYPQLEVCVMVRGGEALNDATAEDTAYVGLDGEARVITNGRDFAGTQLDLLPDDTHELVCTTDLILSKGQGNYETLSGCGLNVFYSLLCKCDLFVSRFGVPFLGGVFVREHVPLARSQI